jgi:hypothetical protein
MNTGWSERIPTHPHGKFSKNFWIRKQLNSKSIDPLPPPPAPACASLEVNSAIYNIGKKQ